MAIWWVITVGFVLCIGFVGGIFLYAIRGALDSNDSARIDPLPKDTP